MNKEKTLKLVKRFPVLYQDFYGDMRSTCMVWGFDHSNGWFEIIWQLSLAIEDELKYTKLQCFMFLLKKRLSRRWNALIYKLSAPREDDFIAKAIKALRPKSWTGEVYYTPKTYLLGMSYARLEMGIKMLVWFPYTGFAVSQVKEKFGTLRFYCPCNDRIDNLVDLAERASSLTCEDCGERGRTRGVFWLSTSCPKCAKDEDLDPENWLDEDEYKSRGLKKAKKKKGSCKGECTGCNSVPCDEAKEKK